MTATAFIQTLDPNDIAPGKRLVGGETLSAIVKQAASGLGGITALAGGGSSNTIQLNNYINEITVCATNNDSVMLPLALAGNEVTIINSGAANLRVYAQLSNAANASSAADVIVALAGGAGVGFVTISPAAFSVFSCGTAGRWKSQNV